MPISYNTYGEGEENAGVLKIMSGCNGDRKVKGASNEDFHVLLQVGFSWLFV